MSEVKGHSRSGDLFRETSQELCQLLPSVTPGTAHHFAVAMEGEVANSPSLLDGDTCTDLVLRNGSDLGLT